MGTSERRCNGEHLDADKVSGKDCVLAGSLTSGVKYELKRSVAILGGW